MLIEPEDCESIDLPRRAGEPGGEAVGEGMLPEPFLCKNSLAFCVRRNNNERGPAADKQVSGKNLGRVKDPTTKR
jgi:hypothetical protein